MEKNCEVIVTVDMSNLSGAALNQMQNPPNQGNIVPTQQEYYRPKEPDPNSVNPLEKPVGKRLGCMPDCSCKCFIFILF